MPTATKSFTATQPIDPPTSARRLLAGSEGPARTQPARQAAPAPAAKPRSTGPRASDAAIQQQGLPRWAKGTVIGGVLLAVAMPASVLMSRSMLVQAALAEQSSSKAAMICTAGEGRATDGSSLSGWLFGGSYFSCGEWETRDARVQRDRDRDQANFMARERAKQQSY
jgi:hypothetical protein